MSNNQDGNPAKRDGIYTNHEARHHVVRLLKKPNGLTLTQAEQHLVRDGVIAQSVNTARKWTEIIQRIPAS